MNKDRGTIAPGEHIHGMDLRMTIDLELNIHDMVAATNFSPYCICPDITPNFRKLIGLSLATGFRKSVRELLGGTKGCVHLVDILGPMATTLFQTTIKKRHKQLDEATDRGENIKPPVINTCRTWSSEGPVVKSDFPDFYTGK